MRKTLLLASFLLVLTVSTLISAPGAAQNAEPIQNDSQDVSRPLSKQPCGGYIVIQVKDDCPECEEFKKNFPECPAYKLLQPPPKNGCELNVCIQKLKEGQLSQCISNDQKMTYFPCCVPGDGSKPSSGKNCLTPGELKCCNGDPCRWGCSGWQIGSNSSLGSSPRCAPESTWKVANPNGLPGCDCQKPGNSPLPPTICSEQDPKLPKECEKFECLPLRPCTIVPDCKDVSCCEKSAYCKANSAVCKTGVLEKSCLKKCTSNGECIYDCKDGCCCPAKEAEKCKEDCVLSDPQVKVCASIDSAE